MGVLRFGVSGLKLLDAAGRFAEAIGELARVPVRSFVATDYDHLLATVQEGAVAIAWLPPLLLARTDAQLVAVSEREHEVTYRSALYVRQDSDFFAATRQALAGARAAWIDPKSSGGYLFPRMHLDEAHVELASEDFFGSYPRAAAAVMDGEADVSACYVTEAAAGSQTRAIDEIRKTIGDPEAALRILCFTDAIPADGIVFGASADEHAPALREALLCVHAKASAALRGLINADRLVPPTAQVQHSLARLRVHPIAAR